MYKHATWLTGIRQVLKAVMNMSFGRVSAYVFKNIQLRRKVRMADPGHDHYIVRAFFSGSGFENSLGIACFFIVVFVYKLFLMTVGANDNGLDMARAAGYVFVAHEVLEMVFHLRGFIKTERRSLMCGCGWFCAHDLLFDNTKLLSARPP
jgi:hypothetical protein